MGFPLFWSNNAKLCIIVRLLREPLCIQLFSVLSTRAYFSDDPRSRVRLNHDFSGGEATRVGHCMAL